LKYCARNFTTLLRRKLLRTQSWHGVNSKQGVKIQVGANDRELDDPYLPPENEYHEWLLAIEHQLAIAQQLAPNNGLSSRTLSPAEISKLMARRTDIVDLEPDRGPVRQTELEFKDEQQEKQKAQKEKGGF